MFTIAKPSSSLHLKSHLVTAVLLLPHFAEKEIKTQGEYVPCSNAFSTWLGFSPKRTTMLYLVLFSTQSIGDEGRKHQNK